MCDRERVKERGWVHSKERECTLEQECVLVRVPSGMGVCMRMCVCVRVCVRVCMCACILRGWNDFNSSVRFGLMMNSPFFALCQYQFHLVRSKNFFSIISFQNFTCSQT